MEISLLFNNSKRICFEIFLGFVISIIFSGSLYSVYGQEFDYFKVETVAENLEVPWAIAFSSDGRIFVTERIGHLRVIEDGQLNPESVAILNVGTAEGGLLGLALDPNFEQNHFLYLYYTYFEFPFTYNKVVRYTENNNALSEELILIEKIPGSPVHDGGRLKFGPDDKLYITTTT